MHDNNLSNFTLIIDLGDFDLHEAESFNVKSMDEEEYVQVVDDFIDDIKVQYDETLEDYIVNEQDFEYESND